MYAFAEAGRLERRCAVATHPLEARLGLKVVLVAITYLWLFSETLTQVYLDDHSRYWTPAPLGRMSPPRQSYTNKSSITLAIGLDTR
jgi:hypothetical protein